MTKAAKALAIIALLFSAACSGSGSSAPAPAPAVLPAPGGVAAAVGDGQITLTWNAVDTAVSYNIYWAQGKTVSASSSNRIGGVTALTYTISSLSNGTEYAFSVSAVGSDGVEGSASSAVTGTPALQTPAVPSGVSLSVENGQVTLQWDAASKADTYNVYWNHTGAVTTADNRIAGINSTTLSQAGLTIGATYYYIITSVNSAGESAASVMPSAMPKTPATGVTARVSIAVSGGNVVLGWTGVDNASSYNIYWSAKGGVTTADNRIVAGAVTSYTHTGITAGARYHYMVTAVLAGGGEGAASSEVSIIP